MKRPRIAVLAIALAAASTGVMAAAGDRWYGTNRNAEIVVTTPVEISRVHTEPVILDEPRVVYAERVAAPVIVEREYVVSEPRYVVIADPDLGYDPLNPETGPTIDRGLFNRSGPNDFGA
jgi:hypothetical protein